MNEMEQTNQATNPAKRIRKKIGSWFTKHPYLWTNPLSVTSIFRGMTGRFRVLPDFIIIGANKCGTTSLYDYLIQHDDVYPALWKELFFFDRYYPRGMNWYRANFPFKSQKFFANLLKKRFLTGDATPTYVLHPLVPKRIFNHLPNAKLILLLRDPVDRAFSHYQMEKRLGYEKLSFEEALEIEEKRLEGERERMIADENYFSYDYQRFSYLTRGIYVDQIKNWLEYFPREQLLILQTEEFLADTSKVYRRVLKFLNLDETDLPTYQKRNVGNYKEMDDKTKRKLIDFYKPHNEELYKYLKLDFNWNGN